MSRRGEPNTGARAPIEAPPPAPDVPAWRRHAVLTVLALASLAVFGKAVQLQVVQTEFLTRKGDNLHIRTVEIPGHRGALRDRYGQPLALSAPIDGVWVVPSTLLKKSEYIEPLAKLLGRKPREFQSWLKAQEKRPYVDVMKPQNPERAARIAKLKAPGVFIERSYSRYYPAGETAGQVVGYSDRSGLGVEGMEKVLDGQLAGHPGQRRVIRARDDSVIEDRGQGVAAEPGQDISLTLDLRLQHLAYRELKSAVDKNGALGGLIVLADAQTGELLAMAAQPGFNPNNYKERTGAGVSMRALADRFEPGSAIKPLMVAQALETGAYRPDSIIDTADGNLRISAQLTVRDVHPVGVANLATVLAKSSNVAAAKVGMGLGAEQVWTGYSRFGLGEKLGMGFPREVGGFLRPWREWGLVGTATASYGYGLSVNALHLVRAYAAIANDGLMPALSLVKGGSTAEPQRVISAATALAMRRLLAGVTQTGGTAIRAVVPGYSVAGKTGTIRKTLATGGYASDRHQSAFIGMLPVEQPRLVAFVMIDEPSAGDYYGGLVAAPVFSNVLGGAARLLQIPQDAPSQTVVDAVHQPMPLARATGEGRAVGGADGGVRAAGAPLSVHPPVPPA